MGENSYDYATVKYDSSGNPVWNFNGQQALRFDDDSENDESIGVAVDSELVVTAGFVTSQSTGKDLFAICSDTDGQIIWIARYPIPGLPNGDEIATALSVDLDGIYVVGSSEIEGVKKVIVLKYSK
jgi:hypothetical protein